MRKLIKGIATIALAMVVGVTSVPAFTVNAKAATSYVTIKKFDQMLQDASGTDKTLIKKGQFSDESKNITREDAAVLVSRAYIAKYGSDIDEDVYKYVKDYKRIKDLSKSPVEKRGAIRRVFVWGLMEGTSSGNYTHTRDFKGKNKLTLADAKTICSRIKDNSKARVLTYDGQVTRTTNLPKTAKYYEYVLDNVPNSYYEYVYRWQYDIFDHKPVRGEDYQWPKYLEKMSWEYTSYTGTMAEPMKYKDTWIQKIETNFKTRLKVNYKTISNKNAWFNTLRGTYYDYRSASNNAIITDAIKDYIKFVKKNKINITYSNVFTDTSTLYDSQGRTYARVHVRFKVTSGNNLKSDASNVFFGLEDSYVEGFKLNKWYDLVFDVELAYGDMGEKGDGTTIFGDGLTNYYALHTASAIKRAQSYWK